MANKYVFSRLSNNQNYTVWEESKGSKEQQTRLKKKVIKISGGADVIGKKSLSTPQGVATTVTVEEAELLKKNPMFKRHAERGHVRIDDKSHEADKVGKDLERDKSAQKTGKDIKSSKDK